MTDNRCQNTWVPDQNQPAWVYRCILADGHSGLHKDMYGRLFFTYLYPVVSSTVRCPAWHFDKGVKHDESQCRYSQFHTGPHQNVFGHYWSQETGLGEDKPEGIVLVGSSHLGYLQPVSAIQRAQDEQVVIDFFKKVDDSIVRVLEILTNSHNEEWLATVLYKDGQKGVIEGVGVKILRQTYSKEALAAMSEHDPEFQFECWLEPREE